GLAVWRRSPDPGRRRARSAATARGCADPVDDLAETAPVARTWTGGAGGRSRGAGEGPRRPGGSRVRQSSRPPRRGSRLALHGRGGGGRQGPKGRTRGAVAGIGD